MLCIVTVLVALSVVSSAQTSEVHPHELLIHRNLRTNECSSLHLQRTQTHKQLRSQPVLFDQASYKDGGERAIDGHADWERLRYIATDVDFLRRRAEDHCGVGYVRMKLSSREDNLAKRADPPPLELHSLIQSGPSANRVDLTFFSDGYTANEKQKFLDDAMRLALDVSTNQTFNTVQPLMNFWAAFTPSNESGVGVGGKPKDTVYGLYRDGTELRGVYYTDADKARAACSSLGDKCDFPILMGNDPLYGGLGGDFTVITPSLANGPLILRHELGHSIIDVGEEYDNGYSYFGVNAAQRPTSPVPWAHWLTGPTRVERSVVPLQAYAWTILNTSTPWSTTFTSSGTYAWYNILFSLSDIPSATDVSIQLDGKNLAWVPRPDIGKDRWFYNVKVNRTLRAGKHEIKFTLKNGNLTAPQLCSVEVLEFGKASEFNPNPGVYSLFPTFDIDNKTSYRPTNDDCCMRLVTTPNYCKVCLEGLWLALLARVELIDGIDIGCSGANRTLEVHLVPLAYLRDHDVGKKEAYRVRWFKDGAEVRAFENKTKVDVGKNTGKYEVDVAFTTEEVRVDKNGYLKSRAAVQVTGGCLL